MTINSCAINGILCMNFMLVYLMIIIHICTDPNSITAFLRFLP